MTCGTQAPRCGCGRMDAANTFYGNMCEQCFSERKREAEDAFKYQKDAVAYIEKQIVKYANYVAKELAMAPLSKDTKFRCRILVDMPGSLPVELVVNGYQQEPIFSWMNHITGQVERA